MTEAEWAKSLQDKESAWAASITKKEQDWSTQLANKEIGWNQTLEDGGGPGMHEVGRHFDAAKGRTVVDYAAGDANTSFWGKAGDVLGVVGKIGGAIAAPFTGGASLLATAGLGGVEDIINGVKGSDIYKTGSSVYDTGKSVYSQFAPKSSSPSSPPRVGVTPIQNLPEHLVAPKLPGVNGPTNNFNSPSESVILKNNGMLILGVGLIAMFFMFKKGIKIK